MKKSGINILELIAVIILVIAGYFFFTKYAPKTSQETAKNNEPTVVTPKDPNLQTYTNSKYGVTFDYPKTISFKNITYVAGDTSVKTYKANSDIPVVVEDISNPPYLLDISIPVLQFAFRVSKKSSDFTRLADYVSKEIEKLKNVAENSVAGIAVSNPNPEFINKNPAISFSIQGGSAMGNNTSFYYLEKGNYIYSFSYFHSAAVTEGLTGDKVAQADAIKRVEAVQKIISSLEIK